MAFGSIFLHAPFLHQIIQDMFIFGKYLKSVALLHLWMQLPSASLPPKQPAPATVQRRWLCLVLIDSNVVRQLWLHGCLSIFNFYEPYLPFEDPSLIPMLYVLFSFAKHAIWVCSAILADIAHRSEFFHYLDLSFELVLSFVIWPKSSHL